MGVREIVEVLIAAFGIGVFARLWWLGLKAEFTDNEREILRERVRKMIG